MITFTRAPTVATGDPITSTQFAKLAAAFNDRLRSGFADGPWRIVFYLLSLFRQIRNSDAEGNLFPPLGEFFTAGYQMLPPETAVWPMAEAGDPEGANLACQINAYVFGAAAIDLDSEDLRLTEPDAGGIPLWYEGSFPATPREFWELAKQQRGSWDPTTGGLGSPAFDAARSHYKIAMSARSPHGNAYGGYLPTPDLAEDLCEDPDSGDDIPAPINYAIRFSPLRDGLDPIEFPGTCQPTIGTPYDDHVLGIIYTPLAYYVLLNSGALIEIPTADYLEGPYTGEAKLRHTANGALQRALNTFVREYRGSDQQRSVKTYWLGEAFDFQKFLTSQYHLAPQRGVESGGSISELYPLFRIPGDTTVLANTWATHTQSGTDHHAFDAHSVLTGCLITATKLESPTIIELWDGSTLLKSSAIQAGEDGSGEFLILLETAVHVTTLKVRLGADTQFTDNTGKIEVECTELLERKPTIEDLFMVLRCGGALTSEAMDGRGIDENSARLIGEEYFANGCITSTHGADTLPGQVAEVNTNGVFDAARRLSQCVRMIPREQFLGYAVEGGKSVCWFRRRAQISSDVDMFAGIGPSRLQITTGALLPERVYVVRTGSIIYQGTEYTEGDTFEALYGAPNFTGEGAVYEHDGIRSQAEPEGETNEWLMGCQFKPYHPSESSLWKPSAFSDYFPLLNRCHFYSPEIANDGPLTWHVAYGNRVAGFYGGVLSPESPTGMNYAPLQFAWGGGNNVNQMDCDEGDTDCEEFRRNFYRSCRIYEPDPEIESAIVEMEGDVEVVKLTFKTRFHHASTAPSSIDRDIGTWDTGALATEAATIRTFENALREYLVHQAGGANAQATGAGNHAANSTIQSNPDNPYGTVYPTFYFVKLIPSPREDGNDDQNTSDTPCTHDAFTLMELYLRAMCEGYIDGATTEAYACEHGASTLFDFSYDSLCYQAFGNRWFTLLPLATRPDNPQGFGPLPNTEMMADTFNQFSASINLLTAARIMLPMKLQVAFDSGYAYKFIPVTDADGSAHSGCIVNEGFAVYADATPQEAPTPTAGDWSEGINPSSSVVGFLDGTCESGNWGLKTNRINSRVRWQTMDPDAILALPPTIADMLDNHSKVLARVTTTTRVLGRVLSEYALSAHCCLASQEPCPGWWNYGGGQFWAFPETVNTVESCITMKGGFAAPALGAGTVARGVTPSGAECTPGPQNSIAVDPITVNAAMVDVPLV